MTIQEKLAKLVNDTMRDNRLSGYEVEARAKAKGYNITQSYVNRIKIGQVGNISVPKQQALAAGLGLPEQEIFDIISGVSREPTSFDEAVHVAFEGSETFTMEQKEDLLRSVRRFVAAIRAENEKK